MELKDRVALRIKTLRRRRGLTQEGLAERIGRTVDAVSNLERGKSLPSFETLEKLAAALESSLRDFFDVEKNSAKATAKRTALVATLLDAASGLSEHDLEIAVQQLEALARRRSPARQATRIVPSGKR